ncbi:MAG: T9SS type A sorting domain-containing protein [Chitinophagaceae bacterium]|nr:T9SS type A sorting domain-containing protein [Chitinophagaceae bacterium]
MRYVLIILVLCIALNPVISQGVLKIESGAVLKTTGSAVVTLEDINLVNDGTINQLVGEGIFRFSGTANNTISGVNAPLFDILQIAKTGVAKLSLQQNIAIGSDITFISGLIDLNNNNIFLQPAASLNGESETSRIMGSVGGFVEITNTLNAPSSINAGNLGAIITSGINLGSTTIRRGHQSQTNGSGLGHSIHRYFDINPSNNSALNATLRFQYFDAELNGLAENILTMWKSENTSNWTSEGFTSRNGTINYVEKTGIPGFSRWTLSSPGNPLPVTGFALSGQWQNNGAKLNWKTETETNNDHFTIQRYYQTGQQQFADVATVPPQHIGGNSTNTTSYDYFDAAVSSSHGSVFYRIRQADIDNRFTFSNTIRITPGGMLLFIDKVYPTIVQSQLNIQVGNIPLDKITITIHDMAGKLIMQKTMSYQSQQVQLPVISSGMYHLKIQSGQWEYKSSFVKQ